MKKLQKFSNSKSTTGFTIVELLIVIVVIGVLAAIIIVAYNGVQQKALYASMKSDVESINKAVLAYYVDYGNYPSSGPSAGNVTNMSSIPGISTYLSRPPSPPNDGLGGYYAYIWSANGTEYKIVRLIPSGKTLLAPELSDPSPDPTRPGRGWGVWSAGGSSL